MKIGILQNGHMAEELVPTSGTYTTLYQALLAGQDFDFQTFSVVDMEFPETVQDCDGWLLTGSRHGVYEDHPFLPPLRQFIRDAFDARVPMVGICFGHQVIAQALGGQVAKFPDGWAIGRTNYNWAGTELTLNAWHQDQVMTPPDGAETVATNAFCKHAALVYDDRAFTLQAHPEFGDPEVDGLTRYRAPGVVPDDLIARAQAALGQDNDNMELARRIGRFFRERTTA